MQDYSLIRSFAERERVASLEARFLEIEAAQSKMSMMAIVARQEGLPRKTVERKFYAWRKGGAMAIADGRKLARPSAESVFYADFKTYAERDLNTTAGGYAAFLRDFRSGKTFRFGTWRDIWRAEFPFSPMPPFCPANWTPRGCTYQNLSRLYKDDPSRAMSLAWSRQGQFAALKYTLPVVRSRVGLKPGQVFQADDVWHNIDVFQPGVKGVFNPLEFAIYDVASAFKAVSAMKPRTLVTDAKTGKEKRDNLKEVQFRFALAYLVCCKGFHKDGATFILERGTTAVRENVQRRIGAIRGEVDGRLFHFQTSGVKNTPAHRGMFVGNAGGNPRMKALCECAHNIMHNATASLLGSHGRDAAHLHESNAALVKYSTDIIAQAEKIDPVLVQMLQLPILDYRHYQQYFYAIEDEVMDRTEHNLEGWADNEELSFRMSPTAEWEPVSSLANRPPDEAAAISAYLRGHPELTAMRKLSRRQVWQRGQKELVRLPLIDMPSFLDPRDVREATVRPDGTIVFEDAVYYPGERKIYLAQYRDRAGLPHRLASGAKVLFYWNPLGELSRQIWIAADDAERSVLGIAPALKTALWNDPESIRVAMGQQQHFIAETMADMRARHAADAARLLAQKEHNAALLGSGLAAKAVEGGFGGGGAAAGFEELAGGDGGECPPEAEGLAGDVDFLERVSRGGEQ